MSPEQDCSRKCPAERYDSFFRSVEGKRHKDVCPDSFREFQSFLKSKHQEHDRIHIWGYANDRWLLPQEHLPSSIKWNDKGKQNIAFCLCLSGYLETEKRDQNIL